MCRNPKSSSHQLASTTPSATSNQRRLRLFTPDEDQILLNLINQVGTQKWQTVAELLGSQHTARQCKERWDILRPNLEAPWTEDEKIELYKLVQTVGKSWNVIGYKMGKSAVSCKNTYEACKRSKFYKFGGTPIQNKIDGLRREREVKKELEAQYPSKQGYIILSEVYLCDQNGNIAIDTVTNTARRIDFVVVQNSQVVSSIEVTSETADKTKQLAKENRIRQNGGHYIRCKGQLISINSVITIVKRRN